MVSLPAFAHVEFDPAIEVEIRAFGECLEEGEFCLADDENTGGIRPPSEEPPASREEIREVSAGGAQVPEQWPAIGIGSRAFVGFGVYPKLDVDRVESVAQSITVQIQAEG